MSSLSAAVANIEVATYSAEMACQVLKKSFAFEADGVVIEHENALGDLARVRNRVRDILGWSMEIEAHVRADMLLSAALLPICSAEGGEGVSGDESNNPCDGCMISECLHRSDHPGVCTGRRGGDEQSS